MADRLVSVDEDNNLPAEVQSALVGSVQTYFESLTTTAEAAADDATNAVSQTQSNLTATEIARDAAEEAAASAQAPTDTMVATLIENPGSSTRVALDEAFGTVVVPVHYSGSWPTRPETSGNSIVMWIGNPGGTAPPEMMTGDIWTQNDNTLTGQWATTAATLTGGITNPSLGTGGSSTGRFVRIGDVVHFMFRIVFGSSGASAGSGTYRIAAPAPINIPLGGVTLPIGNASMLDSSISGRLLGQIVAESTNTLIIRLNPTGTPSSASVVNNSTPWTWAADDVLEGSCTYEAVPA